MFKIIWHLVMLASPVAAAAQRAPAFSFEGVALNSDLDQVARRYPHSTRVGHYIYVAPEDSHDHISGIEISGTGATRRVRISFEIRGDGRAPHYAACARVQTKLEQQFGPPGSVRRLAEEASRRADRLWTLSTEELALICFAGSGGQWLAELLYVAVVPGKVSLRFCAREKGMPVSLA